MGKSKARRSKSLRAVGKPRKADTEAHEVSAGLPGMSAADSRHRHASQNGTPASSMPTHATSSASLVLWRRPLTTLYYASLETLHVVRGGLSTLAVYRLAIILVLALLLICYVTPGPHTAVATAMLPSLLWYGWWAWLGVLSSVGFGTGLHTFVLFLGPFIVRVAVAARECGGLDFPAPPYPHEILCSASSADPASVTLLAVMLKVLPEAVSWGFGTALGELPPYFMARAARLSGRDVDDEVANTEVLQRRRANGGSLTLLEHGKLRVEWAVNSVGFVGILVCASVPNPLFDLAGLTCGHFLVPFSTFFGATVIGKAGFKVALQTATVILLSDEALITRCVEVLARTPLLGPYLRQGVRWVLDRQASGGSGSGNIFGWVFEKFIVCMVLYFLASIVNSAAQSYDQRRRDVKSPKPRRD